MFIPWVSLDFLIWLVPIEFETKKDVSVDADDSEARCE